MKSIGFLPYGTDHPELKFRCSFTSRDEVLALPFTSIVEIGSSTHTHDPVKGMLVGASGGYDLIGLIGASECNSGVQIRFQVPRSWLCIEGDVIPGTERACLLINGGTIGQLLNTKALRASFLGGVNHFNYLRNNTVGSSAEESESTIYNKSEFIDVCYGFIGGLAGGIIIQEVDGRVTNCVATNFTATNAFDRWYFNGMPAHYLRNFQVVSEPPSFPVSGKMSSVVLYGDSYTGTTNLIVAEYPTLTSPSYDETYIHQVEKQLNGNSLFPGNLYGATYGGHTINKDDPTPGTSIQEYIDDVLVKHPSIIVLGAGVNDSRAAVLSVNFDADLKTLITTLMADDFMEGLVLLTIPNTPDTTAHESKVKIVNDFIKAIPAWWDAANPAMGGIVVVEDVYDKFGGDSPNIEYFWTDLVHPNAAGSLIRAKASVNGIKRLMNT